MLLFGQMVMLRITLIWHFFNESPTQAPQAFQILWGRMRRTFPRCFLRKCCWWKKSCTSWCGESTVISCVLYIPGGAGFLPSTVCKAAYERWYEAYDLLPLSPIKTGYFLGGAGGHCGGKSSALKNDAWKTIPVGWVVRLPGRNWGLQ